jgi:tetratricopeptide (TPR) repeat protein
VTPPRTSPLSDPESVCKTLEAERKAEKEFVDKATRSETAPTGWPAALVLFHLGMWRERMRDRLADLAEGRTPAPPPPIEQQNELNDAELAGGIGIPLSDAAARCDHLLGEIIELYARVGDQPYQWYRARTTTEAVLGNSYTHPRAHMHAYFRENGEIERANRLYEEAVTQLRAIAATEIPMGAALYNLAGARAADGRSDDAVKLLEEALRLRPDLARNAAADEDFEALRDDARFQGLIKT